MQERVHFTPPEIKVFEGKAPPTSWVNENIVRFFQIRSQIEFLTDFVSYMRQAMSEKRMQEGKRPFLETIFVSEKEGSPEDIANATLFNSFQGFLASQIKSLMNQIDILKAGDPNLSRELDETVNQLYEVTKGFPNLSKEELSFLATLMKRLNELSKKIPFGAQRTFWEEENGMLEQMFKANETSIQEYEGQINQTQNKMEQMAQFRNQVSSMLSQFTAGNIRDGLSQFISMLNGYKNLPPYLQNAFKNSLNRSANMRGKNGASFPQVLGEAQLSQWIQQLGGKPTREQVIDYVHQQLDKPPFNTFSPPFMADFVGAMNKSMQSSDFPASISHDPSAFAFEPKSAQQAHDDVNAFFEQKQQRYQNQIGGMKKGVGEMRGAGETLGKAAAWGAGKSAGSGSLPNRFQHAILGKYMPGQEKYLMELAELLMFDNMGADIGNALLNITTDFSAAATNYNLNDKLHSNGIKGYPFTGSPGAIKAAIKKEEEQAYNDYRACEKAIAKIDSELAKIKNDPNLTASQKKQLEGKLNHIKHNLEKAKKQVHSLLETLKSLKVHASPSKKHFQITSDKDPKNWQKDLATEENDVINGNLKSDPPGGLIRIGQEITTFQQYYSNQSTKQQMVLQMRMTEIQQEWTVVSQALQNLNQMYMVYAQAIYK